MEETAMEKLRKFHSGELDRSKLSDKEKLVIDEMENLIKTIYDSAKPLMEQYYSLMGYQSPSKLGAAK